MSILIQDAKNVVILTSDGKTVKMEMVKYFEMDLIPKPCISNKSSNKSSKRRDPPRRRRNPNYTDRIIRNYENRKNSLEQRKS
jgi:hypothetical protein